MQKKMIKDIEVTDVTTDVTLAHAIAELERELAVRRRIYDDWVKAGKLAYVDAYDRYCRLLFALAALNKSLDLADVPA